MTALIYEVAGVLSLTHIDDTADMNAMLTAGVLPFAVSDNHFQIAESAVPAEPITRWSVDWATSTITINPMADADLRAYSADKRWQVETGGIVVNTVSVPTDDRAKMLLEGAAATLADTDTVAFKTATAWITLDGLTIRALRDAVSTHVQGAFAAEKAIDAAITAGTITTTAEIDAYAWPSNT